jgi:hypothetical protein
MATRAPDEVLIKAMADKLNSTLEGLDPTLSELLLAQVYFEAVTKNAIKEGKGVRGVIEQRISTATADFLNENYKLLRRSH